MDGFKTTKSYKISTPDGYDLYIEESGHSDGIPALFLHGGPGAGIGQNYQWPFADGNYRLIAFDQRGCGRSQPFGSLQNNTTDNLIDDIELIRSFFGIDKWLLFGGSWGSTLALCYAIAKPQHVSAMILRGIFLGRSEDADWFLSPQGGAAQVYPAQYKKFVDGYDNSTSLALCEGFYKDLSSEDENIRNKAAIRWFNWEGSISKLMLTEQDYSDLASIQQVYSLALMECFYVLNKCFIKQNHILNNSKLIQHIPTHIVHGRYDMVCKCESAVTLHEHLPESSLCIVADAGHSMNEGGISKALVESLNYFANNLR